jgi:hypothetical protein
MGIDLGAPAAINNLCTTGATGGVGTFTVMSWVYLDNVTGTQVIMATGHGIDASGLTQPSTATRGGWGFSANTTNLRYTTYGSTDNTVTVTPALAAGSWYHVALTFDNGVAQVFVNGNYMGQDTSLGTFRQENSVSYYIGSSVQGTALNPGGGGDYFLGRMDEIKLFNTVLTAAEIQAAAMPEISSSYGSWASTNAGGQAANLDFDDDGVPNGVEYFMNAAPGFTVNPQLDGSNAITWPNEGNIPAADYGTQFVVQTSSDLVDWADVPVGDLTTNTDGPGGSLTYTLTGTAPRFVRLKVTPN